MRIALLVLVAACGDNLVPPAALDAPPPPPCSAAFTGNVTETATTDESCIKLTGTLLLAKIPTHLLDASLDFMLDLGTTAIVGTYTSDALASWGASGVRTVDHRFCHYSAGNAVAPHGSFTLALAADMHGHLELVTYVLADPFTDCGDPITESVALDF